MVTIIIFRQIFIFNQLHGMHTTLNLTTQLLGNCPLAAADPIWDLVIFLHQL